MHIRITHLALMYIYMNASFALFQIKLFIFATITEKPKFSLKLSISQNENNSSLFSYFIHLCI